MKRSFMSIGVLFILVTGTNAQNSSPYWSLAGNNNATSSAKLGTTNLDPVNIITNNSIRLRIDPNGNVGVGTGTATPVKKFQVNGFGAFGNRVTSANANRALNLVDDNAVMRVLRVSASNAPAVELISRTSADGANVSYWDFYTQPGDASFRIRDRQYSGSGLDRITITHSNGYVGVGTTSPYYKFHVEDAGTAIYGRSSAGGFGVYGSSTYLGVYGTGNDYGVYGTGNYSSGTGVFGAGYYGLYGSGGTYGVYGSGSSYGLYGTSSSGYGVSGVSSSATAIYGSGNFGVYGRGTSTGTYGVGSTYGVSGFSSGGVGVNGYSSSNYGVYGQSYSNIGGYFYSTSSHGIWARTVSTASNIYAGVFQGNVYTYGTYSTSDKNLKKNIQDVSDAMSIINKLKPKNYEFRNDGKYLALQLPKGNHYGLLAQDLEQVLPGLVREAPLMLNKNATNDIKKEAADPAATKATASATGGQASNPQQESTEIMSTKAVNYTELIPIMIRGMQEQSTKIREQQSEISDLKSEISDLKLLVSKIGNGQASMTVEGYLKQNAPNPSGGNTLISYYTPENMRSAQMVVSDMKGRVLKSYNLSRGQGQVNIKAGELPAGSYNYTLYINSNRIDTKQMIIAR